MRLKLQSGNSALLLASCNGRADVVRWLVTEAGCDARSDRNRVSFSVSETVLL
jgi:hypothetical protein